MSEAIHLNPTDFHKSVKFLYLFIPVLVFILLVAIIIAPKSKGLFSPTDNSQSVLGEEVSAP